MSKNETKVVIEKIKLPGEDYPYMNCVILEGSVDQIGEEKFVFTTESKAHTVRKITVSKNGVITSEIVKENPPEDEDE